MTRRLLFRPEAQNDLEETVLWYEDQKPSLGQAFSGELFALLQQIAESPLRFPAAAPNVRRALLSKFPYTIYFILEEPAVVVIAVLHHRRDPAVWKRRV